MHSPVYNDDASVLAREDSADSATPTPTNCPSLMDDQISAVEVHTVNMPQLYDWYSVPYDNHEHVEKVLEELKEMDRSFRAETKESLRRLEQSRHNEFCPLRA
jgi:hypothetical protein